jgi:hypothetical protein
MGIFSGSELGVRRVQVLVVVVVLAIGFEVLVNAVRYNTVSGDIATVGDELNTDGEDAFRSRLVEMLATSGEVVDPADVTVSLDTTTNEWNVGVPYEWVLTLPGKRYVKHTTLHSHVRKHTHYTN